MPRSGIIGTYSLPPNTNNQAPNTPISSSMFNAFASDVQQTFNDPTPVAYGGTGASDAAGARANINALGPNETADRAFRRGNILGTVSQSGGVPTGAIIERGSNANGEYVRFADGTQICHQIVDHTDITSGIPMGALVGTSVLKWTYPAAFIGGSAPVFIGSGQRSNDTIIAGVSTRGITSTDLDYIFWLTSFGAGAKSARLAVLGRWF